MLDTVGGLIMYTEDISQQKEQQLQLKIAKRKAEQASKAKEQFLSTMSHEIRTPLNAIIGMTDLMLMENQTEEQLKRLSLLKFSGSNLLRLINDILDFNKIEAGKLEFEVVDFNLKKLLEKIRGSLLNLTDQKNLDFNLKVDPDLPDYVKGDEVRLGQVLTNLVNNAIKFTEDGHITLKARLVNEVEDRVSIKFEVKDTGIGIAKDKLETIFQTFEQGGVNITRKYGGSGLGLAITKKILALMNSSIKVHSTEGLGSVFFFELELPVGNAPAILETEVADGTAVRDDVCVLVAEDNEGNRILIESLFRKWQIKMEFAFDGLQAVKKVQTKKFDMIFMDLQMPEMDGYEATKTIRSMEDEYFKEIPIIALTASVMSNVLEKTKEVGMNAYVSKPFDPVHLKNTIATYTNKVSKETINEEVKEAETPPAHVDPLDQFKYLKSLVGDDKDSLKEIVETTLKSVVNATNGVKEGLEANDVERVRRELHVLRPNLHNIELGGLIADLPKITELEPESKKLLQELIIKVETELSTDGLKLFL
jgi:CheY-like chemotaxis protein/nitrogen-specific signal transduction histidine kinase